MIIIEDKTIQKPVYFPKEKDGGNACLLKLFSHLSKNEITFDISGCTTLDLYYVVDVDWSGVYDGEWNWTILNEENSVLQNGVLRIGEYDGGDVIYDFKEEYVVYNPETGESEIIEYGDCTDAVNEAYHQGYESGYTEGYERGQEECEGCGWISIRSPFNLPYSATQINYEITANQPFDMTAYVMNDEMRDWVMYAPTVHSDTSPYIGTLQIPENSGTTVKEYMIAAGLDDDCATHFEAYVIQAPASADCSGVYEQGFEDGYSSGYTDGLTSGKTEGYSEGYESGFTDGYESGCSGTYEDAYNAGLQAGYQSGWTNGISIGYGSGYTEGYQEGYVEGNADGFSSGYSSGWESGYTSGYTDGYSSGWTDGYTSGSTPTPPTPSGWTDKPFTIEMLENGNINWEGNGNTLYSVNGSDRQVLNGSITGLTAGDIVEFSVSADTRFLYAYKTLTASGRHNVMGNIMSLNYADFESATTLMSNSNYKALFENNTNLISAENLLLPAVSQDSYYQMFYGCTNLTKAPELPTSTLASYCYFRMFYNCPNLTYIKCLATDSAFNATTEWVSNVSATGTFYKKAGTTWASGVDGIPEGWTVIEV